MDSFKRILSRMIRVNAYASSALLFVIMVAVFFDAALRYAFGVPVPGAYDFTQVFMASIVFLGIAYAEDEGHHIRATIFVSRLPRRLATAANIFACCCGLALFLVITVQGIAIFIESAETLEYLPGSLKVPVYPARGLLVLGAAVMCCRLMISLAELFSGRQRVIEGKSIE